MAFSQNELEYYHNKGQMPDWIYYQLSDKPAWMKMEEQHRRMYEMIKAREEAKAQKEAEKKMEKDIQDKTEEAVEKSLSRIFENFRGFST